VKTTIEIPDVVFRRAKSLAGSLGISLKQRFIEAIEERLQGRNSRSGSGTPSWMKLAGAFGKTPAMRAETRRIEKLIEEEFEQIEVEDRT
jgi:hypothetical protein